MSVTDRIEQSSARNAGTLMAILLLIQVVLLPGVAWILIKQDDMQATAAQTSRDVAVFGDRQTRQGKDINEVKDLMRGVYTQKEAEKAHQKIWDTDSSQYDSIRALQEGQNDLKNRVERLEDAR